jgi:hypothetical protein
MATAFLALHGAIIVSFVCYYSRQAGWFRYASLVALNITPMFASITESVNRRRDWTLAGVAMH